MVIPRPFKMQLSLTQDELDRLDELVKSDGTNRNVIIRRALDRYYRDTTGKLPLNHSPKRDASP